MGERVGKLPGASLRLGEHQGKEREGEAEREMKRTGRKH